jgi:hypothetical protein
MVELMTNGEWCLCSTNHAYVVKRLWKPNGCSKWLLGLRFLGNSSLRDGMEASYPFLHMWTCGHLPIAQLAAIGKKPPKFWWPGLHKIFCVESTADLWYLHVYGFREPAFRKNRMLRMQRLVLYYGYLIYFFPLILPTFHPNLRFSFYHLD